MRFLLFAQAMMISKSHLTKKPTALAVGRFTIKITEKMTYLERYRKLKTINEIMINNSYYKSYTEGENKNV